MKLLAISEHYFPRVGGTVNYVHETLCHLAALGVEAELLVPGPAPEDWAQKQASDLPYLVTWIDAGYPSQGDPARDARYAFCQKVDAVAAARMEGPDRPDVLHVLFGLFVMEVLNTERLRHSGLPCIATVHNVPPLECRQIVDDVPPYVRLKEDLRLKAVGWKNRKRLKAHSYDLYVAPSEQVRVFLAPIVGNDIQVVAHGPTSDLQRHMHPPASRLPGEGPLRLLTVGGYAPHKRQHILPETAEHLRAAGVKFIWDIAGPPGRVPGYVDSIAADLAARGMQDIVHLHPALPVADLGALYDSAHLYVQPSTEEGFCLTALDAAAAGLPVIGCPAGALPDIISTSGGDLVNSDPAELARIITRFVDSSLWPDAKDVSARVQQEFSWAKAANTLMAHYERHVR